ncbi:hypothetical protein CcaverHIS002_0506040 [Cutaneotrichosporon cavernicola]|uniref:ATP11-domain-containing protein n=1 Tax=Cutaneotrichosporon cavernicola TaxID=279322 RepID=A0AA48QWZ6_9TREE|nr:uncharacterized protein CcaverHIS019_0506570 [Cutaneotrichosporon cavernicola]BEI85203.1 hypothetical protein CcaverHIS002_0506040 [Cutaneotrichosporon cavernicola]BEI93029.1 hypothetical protein CcaverHIS019_0506570 [Cutaneotrichosporon cavernicola]BEJ00805.1 hypothetical protein CcaverHIS631_0506620 [Cutaneotrichosporon cavernicola]BEJ08572.1 hypothetical protein CcaverHIS641_0506660 [Cutaneotrichosporon cavernicola]
MLRTALARLPRVGASSAQVRAFTASSARADDIIKKLEESLTPREAVERKRKEFEAKYGDKLKKKVEAEGVANLDALKTKKVVPSILAKRKAEQYRQEEADRAERDRIEQERVLSEAKDAKNTAFAEKKAAARAANPDRDTTGVKPLSSVINLPLILMTPHSQSQVAAIWNTFHTTHPTLAGSYLSATLPKETYQGMLQLAKSDPFFVVPLPRQGKDGASDAFEMFYLQWLFHVPPAAPPLADGKPTGPLPPVTSVIFTPLEEFKQAGEWAQPYLVLTHYPDLADSHGLVLMRGEISAQTAGGPPGAVDNPGYLLTQQDAQLLTLALQRFYCSDIAPPNETAKDKDERLKRKQALRDFREKPEEWDWNGLVDMAYGGLA